MSTLRCCSRASTHLRAVYNVPRRAYTAAATEWQVVIGLEIHAQIRSPKKLFSHAATCYGETVNTQVHKHDIAIPGSLPVSLSDARY
jgi:hypothetical protein